MSNVVVIDDDRSVCEMIRRSLQKIDLVVSTAATPEEGLRAIRSESPDVVLLDIVLPGTSGLEVFQQIRDIDRRLPIIFITAGSDSSTAIRAMQLGGYDYVTKPLDLPSLSELVEKAIATRRMMNTPVALHMSDEEFPNTESFVGRSPAMLEVFKSIGRVAAQNVPVLIRGESGTGKELVARAIYQNSARSGECFLAINCAALPDALLESELFGHEKGSFTGADRQRIGKFEACNGGTIFLDEIGDMSPLVQGKVLRLLQQQEFERVGGNKTIKTDVRVVTATNLDLDQMVADGEFREDLFYRLNGSQLRCRHCANAVTM
jgi:DNA-binding NtrC family response regulator